jgi:hypothetical protein
VDNVVEVIAESERIPMSIRLDPHARERFEERGAAMEEVIATVEHGEVFHAKFGRTGFRRNFVFQDVWRGKWYENKQVEAIAVREDDDWLVITVITRFF